MGVLLSGGADPSLITGLRAETGTPDLRAYAIGFETTGGEASGEFQHSDLPSALPGAGSAIGRALC